VILELITKKLLDTAFSAASDVLKDRIAEYNKKRSKVIETKDAQKTLSVEQISAFALHRSEPATADILLPKEATFERLSHHVEQIRTWSQAVNFADMQGSKKLTDIYVPPDTFLVPSYLHIDESEKVNTVDFRTVIASWRQHCIILGQPGAGKTTCMKHLCERFLSGDFATKQFSIILLLRFRDTYQPNLTSNIILTNLLTLFPLEFQFGGCLAIPSDKVNEDETVIRSISRERQLHICSSFTQFLDSLAALIVLDGLDEYPDIVGREEVIKELRELTANFKQTRIILTCRTGEFPYSVENARIYEIAPLRAEQIRTLAIGWLGSDNKATEFISGLANSPFGSTAMKPLLLAHLCAIYERIHKVPDRPKTVYRKIVNLLLEEWDQQRSVNRPSRYSKFEADRKFEFLSHLAFYLSTSTRASVFTRTDLIDSYRSICKNFGLPENEAELAAAEIESHTGLLIQSGYEKYEFVHKSIQEYLGAEYIVKLPNIPEDHELLENLVNELAITIVISSNPSLYFVNLVLNCLPVIPQSTTFYESFINRIIAEKPDLYEESSLVVALFTIYTRWINQWGTRVVADSFREDSAEIRMYRTLRSVVTLRNPGLQLQVHYEFTRPYITGANLLRICRRAGPEQRRFPQELLIPRALMREEAR
jgi:NACHT domain